jgi:hypothetical protein
MGDYKIKDNYIWEYKVKRKNESSKTDLPKNRISKSFLTKEDALKYAKEKKSNWLQASLWFSKAGGKYSQIAGIGVSGKYSEKFY